MEVKLVRDRNGFQAFYKSIDETNWTFLDSVTFSNTWRTNDIGICAFDESPQSSAPYNEVKCKHITAYEWK